MLAEEEDAAPPTLHRPDHTATRAHRSQRETSVDGENGDCKGDEEQENGDSRVPKERREKQ